MSELEKTFDIGFRFSAIGMALVSLDGNWLKVNDSLLNMLGYDQKEILGKSTLDITHKQDIAPSKKLIKEVASGKKENYNLEKRYIRKDGRVIWVSLSVSLVRNDKEEPIYYLSQIQDITSKKEIEESLKISQARFDLAMRGSNSGLWDWDFKSEKLYFSPRFKEILGITDPKFTPDLDKMEALLHPNDRERRAISLSLHLKAKIPYNVEYRMKHAKGHYVWIHSRGQAQWNDSGQPIRMSSSVEDVTHRKLIEQQLKKSEERLALVVNSTTDGVWDWNNIGTKHQEVYWSPQLFKLIGCDSFNDLPSYELILNKIHPEDRGLLEDAVSGHLNRGNEFNIQLRIETDPSRYEWFKAKGSKSVNDKGNIRFTGSITNISAEKVSEAKIEEYMNELVRINSDLDDFAYIASHDLNEPIRGVSNNAIFLKEDFGDKLGEEGLRRIDRIMFLCMRMEKLVSDLLHFARIKNQDLQMQKVDLNNVIDDIKATLENFLTESNAKIILPKKLPRIICDEVIITELFKNLIVNGIKYNKSKEKIIEIGYTNENSEDEMNKYCFYVKDNGIGIKDEHHKDIFRIFKRLNSEDYDVKGTGIGLTFVKKIVERHNGQIWLESELGNGSKFNFTVN